MTEHKSLVVTTPASYLVGQLVQISAQRPAILTAVSHGYPQCFHTGKCQNKYLNLGHNQFPPQHLQFSIHKVYYHLALTVWITGHFLK